MTGTGEVILSWRDQADALFYPVFVHVKRRSKNDKRVASKTIDRAEAIHGWIHPRLKPKDRQCLFPRVNPLDKRSRQTAPLFDRDRVTLRK